MGPIQLTQIYHALLIENENEYDAEFLCLGGSRREVTEHWEWLEMNLLQTLSIFENENDITTFVKGKIQVIIFMTADMRQNHIPVVTFIQQLMCNSTFV